MPIKYLQIKVSQVYLGSQGSPKNYSDKKIC